MWYFFSPAVVHASPAARVAATVTPLGKSLAPVGQAELFVDPPEIIGGRMKLTQAPGLGLEVTWLAPRRARVPFSRAHSPRQVLGGLPDIPQVSPAALEKFGERIL